MESHFLLLVLFSLFVSVIFSVVMRENPVEQFEFGAKMLAGLVIAAIVLGWLMYPFPL